MWTSVPWQVACELISRIGPTLCLDRIVTTLRLFGVSGVCTFKHNLPPALLAEWRRPFTCHCGNERVERTPNKSQHRKLTLEKKILLPLPPRIEPATLRSRVLRSTHWTTPTLWCLCGMCTKREVFLSPVCFAMIGSVRLFGPTNSLLTPFTGSLAFSPASPRAHLHVVGMLWFMFYSVLVLPSVFMAFNCISFQLSVFWLCSSGFISALLVLST